MNSRIYDTLSIPILFLTISILGQQKDSAEWKPLFDGKTLHGWEQLGGTAKYEVKDGMIVGTTVVGSPNSFLCTKKHYGNFILEMEFKVDEGLNSGIQVRSQSLKEYRDGIVHGYQVEIDPARKEFYSKNPPNRRANGEIIPPNAEPRSWTGGIYDEKRRGWLYDLTGNEVARNAFKPGNWNQLRIEAIGDAIRTWVNGVPAANIVDSMTPNGFIGLQVHATKNETPMHVYWKNIRIQDLGFNAAQPQMSPDIFTGDWQTDSGDLVAKIFILNDSKYQANLRKEFISRNKPLVVLTGQISGNNLLLQGDGWDATVSAKRFKGQKGETSFEMRRIVNNFPTLDAMAPKNAIVLFDGSNVDEWTKQKTKEWLTPDGPADNWKIIPGGRLEVVPESNSIITKRQFSDFFLHVEFRVLGEETNGGVYLLSRYEINIKDSYGIYNGPASGALGNTSVPRPVGPIINAAAPAFQWQTFDINFRAPRFNANNEKTENARITVSLNGVTLYENIEPEVLKGAAKRLGEAASGPIMLQEHGTAYQFRNIWIVDKSKL